MLSLRGAALGHEAHAQVAEAKGMASAIAVNGTMLDLTGPAPKVAEFVETGRTYLDGSVKIGALDGVVRDRIRAALNGQVFLTVLFDEDDAPLGGDVGGWVQLNDDLKT